MTVQPGARRIPEDVHVLEVYGSTFLLEWLDRDVLAAAAARCLTDDGGAPGDEAEVRRPA